MIQVMLLWFCAFCVIGNAVFPYAAGVLGFDTLSFTERGLATYSLCLDFVQMFMTVFVLRQSLRPFRPLDLNWFPVKWLNDKKCVRDVAVACLRFHSSSGFTDLARHYSRVPASWRTTTL